jgi:hypothetical protein
MSSPPQPVCVGRRVVPTFHAARPPIATVRPTMARANQVALRTVRSFLHSMCTARQRPLMP